MDTHRPKTDAPLVVHARLRPSEVLLGPKINVFDSGKCVPNGKRLDLVGHGVAGAVRHRAEGADAPPDLAGPPSLAIREPLLGPDS